MNVLIRLRYVGSLAMLGCVSMGAICGWSMPVIYADRIHIIGAVVGMILGVCTLDRRHNQP